MIWAVSTRVDPARDSLLVENTAIDYLDFATPVSGVGSKLGLDATRKWAGESAREWGRPITLDPQVERRVDTLWRQICRTLESEAGQDAETDTLDTLVARAPRRRHAPTRRNS